MCIRIKKRGKKGLDEASVIDSEEKEKRLKAIYIQADQLDAGSGLELDMVL